MRDDLVGVVPNYSWRICAPMKGTAYTMSARNQRQVDVKRTWQRGCCLCGVAMMPRVFTHQVTTHPGESCEGSADCERSIFAHVRCLCAHSADRTPTNKTISRGRYDAEPAFQTNTTTKTFERARDVNKKEKTGAGQFSMRPQSRLPTHGSPNLGHGPNTSERSWTRGK